jgi:hypothetical protein
MLFSHYFDTILIIFQYRFPRAPQELLPCGGQGRHEGVAEGTGVLQVTVMVLKVTVVV